MSPAEVLDRAGLKMMVTTTVSLGTVDAVRAASQLRPLFPQGGPRAFGVVIATNRQNNSLVLRGFADDAAAAIRVLGDIDKSAEEIRKASKIPVTVDTKLRLSSLEAICASQKSAIANLKREIAALREQVAILRQAVRQKIK